MRTLTLSLMAIWILLAFGMASAGYNTIFVNPVLTTHSAVAVAAGATSVGPLVYTSLANSVTFLYSVASSTGVTMRLNVVGSLDDVTYGLPATGATTAITRAGVGIFRYGGPYVHSMKAQFVNDGSVTNTVTCKAAIQ